MENSDTSNHSKRILRRDSRSHVSMSDTESTTSQADSFHSPLRSESPLRSDDHLFQPENDDSGENNCRTIVVVDKYHFPVPSPGKLNFPASSPDAGGNYRRPWPHSENPVSENPDFPSSPRGDEGKAGRRSQYQPAAENLDFPANGQARAAVVVGVSKSVRAEAPSELKKMGPVGDGGEDEVGGERRSRAAVAAILRRPERNAAVKKVALSFRVFEAIAYLISFSVMAADRTRGWSGDSFHRYIEYRYCVAVNVIGFVYSSFQAFDLAYHLATGKHVVVHYLRCHFDFAMDQILAYLLMSASSSAATRADDWISNWGADEFLLMASSSIAMSFLAFVAFALSSLVSGYDLCYPDSTWKLGTAVYLHILSPYQFKYNKQLFTLVDV